MIEYELERARLAALANAEKAIKEKRGKDADTAITQVAAVIQLKKLARQTLDDFGVPDIPLSWVQEGPIAQVSQLSPSPEQSRGGKRLDIVQDPKLREELERVGLSERVRNLLLRADILDVEKIAAMTDEDLLNVRNLGPVSLQEIREKLDQCLPRIKEERRAEREENKKRNKDPHFHAERIGELAEDYAHRLSWRYRSFLAQGEEKVPTGVEILEGAVERYLRKFGFFEFPKEDINGLKAHMIYTKEIRKISTRQDLSSEESTVLLLHFLAHIALEHENQTALPDIFKRFEKENRKSLSKTTLEEEKEADKWVRSFMKAIVARVRQRYDEPDDED